MSDDAVAPTHAQDGMMATHVRRNRARWDAKSAEYQQRNAPLLNQAPLAWGVWRCPEAELQILGDVQGRDILELGCGAAQWSLSLAAAGARPVGLDASISQLAHARVLVGQVGAHVPLVLADAERLPLRADSFDILCCDWGAMSFCDPYRTVPEAARVLRPGGVLAFSSTTPIVEICWNEAEDRFDTRLLHDYFGQHAIDDPADGMTIFSLPYGEWIRLFRQHGFVIEDLIELRPAPDATSTYRSDADRAWARRWPMEQVWKVRKAAAS